MRLAESRSVPLERWVDEERGMGTKVEVSEAPRSGSWGLTRTSPNRITVNTACLFSNFRNIGIFKASKRLKNVCVLSAAPLYSPVGP